MFPTDDEIEKAILEKSLIEYVQWRFEKRTKKKFILNWHHITLCDAFEDVFYGRTTYLLVNLPPRYTKTEICVKAFAEWSMIKTKARAKFIHLSYSDELALDNSAEIRESIKSDWFRKHWQFDAKPDKDSKSKWETSEGGGLYATGTMGSITGFGAGSVDDDDEFAGAIIIDDPIKPQDAYSDTIRDKANERLNNTILSRCNNPKKTPVIIIMQRLHEMDMCGFCLAGKTDKEWKHLNLSAIQVDADGNEFPLWEYKHTLPMLQALQKADPKMFAGQYEQKPAPSAGNIIPRAGIKTFTVLPSKIDKWVISADCTFKDTKKSDFVVFQLWAKAGAEYYLVDQVRDKMSFTATATAFKAFCDKYPHVTRKLIEDKANGTAIIDSLKKVVSGLIAINPKDSKIARAYAVSSYFDAGNVYVKAGTGWLSKYIEELVAFPNGSNDDQVDATTQALMDFTLKAVGNFTDDMLATTMNNNNISQGQW